MSKNKNNKPVWGDRIKKKGLFYLQKLEAQ